LRLARFALPCFLFAAAVSAQHDPHIVIAKGVGPAPGAVVCHDLATVSAMVDLYAASLEERMQAIATGGASSRVNGTPLPPPDLARHGCALAKPGTELRLLSFDQAEAVVSLRLSTGREFKGVTQLNMVRARDRR
jgi:hypothetical protein